LRNGCPVDLLAAHAKISLTSLIAVGGDGRQRVKSAHREVAESGHERKSSAPKYLLESNGMGAPTLKGIKRAKVEVCATT